MCSDLNPLVRLRRSVGPIAALLLLFFGATQAVAAWHVTRGADQDKVVVMAGDLATSPAGGHVDDGCALCSTPIQPTFSAVLTPLVQELAQQPVVARYDASFATSHHELGASGPRAPPFHS